MSLLNGETPTQYPPNPLISETVAAEDEKPSIGFQGVENEKPSRNPFGFPWLKDKILKVFDGNTQTSQEERKALFSEIAQTVIKIESKRKKIIDLQKALESSDTEIKIQGSYLRDELSEQYAQLALLESQLRDLRKKGVYDSNYTTVDLKPSPFLSDFPKQSERYTINDSIKEGSLTNVDRAIDNKMEREVILKRIDPRMVKHPKALSRLFAEAKALAEYTGESRYVVPIYDVYKDGETIVIVMPYLEGYKSSVTVCSELRLDLIDAIYQNYNEEIIGEKRKNTKHFYRNFFLTTAANTDFVRKKMHHKDIKTENFITNQDGQAVIIDFGIANLVNKDGYGTPIYMSPERIGAPKFDPENYDEINDDIYALAVSYFQVLAGDFPLILGDAPEMLANLFALRTNKLGAWNSACDKLETIFWLLKIQVEAQNKIKDLLGKALGIYEHLPNHKDGSRVIAFANASDFAQQLAACFE